MQVIHYSPLGHYAVHSDSGWPGHRSVSLVIYLKVPLKRGETCFVPQVPLLQAHGLEYAQRCKELQVSAGGLCPAVRKGDALIWANKWNQDGRLEVPGAHVACPVLQGTKWVASAWLDEAKPCPPGHICTDA